MDRRPSDTTDTVHGGFSAAPTNSPILCKTGMCTYYYYPHNIMDRRLSDTTDTVHGGFSAAPTNSPILCKTGMYIYYPITSLTGDRVTRRTPSMAASALHPQTVRYSVKQAYISPFQMHIPIRLLCNIYIVLKLDLYDKNNLQIYSRILSETSILYMIRHASVIQSADLHL